MRRGALLLTLCLPLLALTGSVPSAATPTPAAVATVAAGSAATAGMPSERRWRADVRRAMRGTSAALRGRVARAAPGERLALNLDIDNTSLRTYYAQGKPVARVLRLAREADALGVDVLFNTARHEAKVPGAVEKLRAAGYPVDGICARRSHERVVPSKQRCRTDFADAGWTLVLNIGNQPTDLEGGGYERGVKLPDYGLRLG